MFLILVYQTFISVSTMKNTVCKNKAHFEKIVLQLYLSAVSILSWMLISSRNVSVIQAMVLPDFNGELATASICTLWIVTCVTMLKALR